MSGQQRSPYQAALACARYGWPVLPIIPGEKTPVTKHGCNEATTDPRQIADWWRRNPGRNVAIATGAPGPDVLDVDVHRAPERRTGSDLYHLLFLRGRCASKVVPPSSLDVTVILPPWAVTIPLVMKSPRSSLAFSLWIRFSSSPRGSGSKTVAIASGAIAPSLRSEEHTSE